MVNKVKKPGLRKVAAPLKKVDLDKLDQFAAGGKVEKPEEKKLAQEDRQEKAITYPWEESWVRSDVIKGMGVPLSEPYLLKLQFIAQNTRYSQRKFCREKLEAAIDRELEMLLDEES